MDRGLADQRRYLAALAAAAASEPATHACQLAALAREQALAAVAVDAAAYRRASGDLFELARAAWLDRLLAHARVAAAHDDPWTARAMAAELTAALAADGHAGWTDALADGSRAAHPWHERAGAARGAFAGLVVAVCQAAWDPRPSTQAEAGAAIAAHAATWLALDAPASARAALAQPRHAAVVPWTGAGLDALARRLDAAIAGASGAPVDAPPATETLAAMERAAAAYRAGLGGPRARTDVDREPTVAEVVAPYAGLAALPGDAPALVRLRAAAAAMVADAAGAATPQEVLAVWTERDRLAALGAAPVVAEAEATLARTASWPDPIRAAGARALLDDLARSRTGTAVDLVAMHHGACALAEASWSRALAEVVLAPLTAAAIAGWDPTAAAARATAWALAGELAGVGATVLDAPLVTAVLDALVAHPRAAALGAHLGEIGHGLAGETRAFLAVQGLAATSRAALADHLRGAWGQPPPAHPRPVVLWGHAVALARLGDEVPARPPVPGRSGRGDP